MYDDIIAEKIRLDNGVDLYLVYDGNVNHSNLNLLLRQFYLIDKHVDQRKNYLENEPEDKFIDIIYNKYNELTSLKLLEQDNNNLKEFLENVSDKYKSI
jgi:hypothetical protein